ncbi:GNAT family N-acetyltransferase [Streptomyces luteoverticillatus]|uniref:GNAT family N-acetyltransferase n=1 Tax=Streptomyces luteoverticillatus TaxID=66425 RepID=A0A3S9PPG8_STRLT|nr:GNAT family N-acetyltransferase [Streptomyces luteoverticillatus]AZQ74217.1 GNAT family N-acetyltransferase [Streptomyces luteoverticillatus]
MVTIRTMTAADAAAVAEIRVSGWRAAYTGIVPQGYLDAMDPVANAAAHRERLASGAGPVVDAVAEAAGAVVGWACYGPCRDAGRDRPPGTGELYALYVRPELIGTGVGRALWIAALEGLRKLAGHEGARVVLWVAKDNTRARRFYERAGCRPDGAERSEEYAGTAVPEVRYVLDPLRAP